MDAMMFALLGANKKKHTQSTAEREIADAIADYEMTTGRKAHVARRGFLKGFGL